MAQLVKRQLLKHEHLHLAPPPSHKSKGWRYTPLTSEQEEWRQADLRAHWPASFAEISELQVRDRSCL